MDYLEYYADTKPDVLALRKEFDKVVVQLEPYKYQCQAAYDDRRCYWSGKSADLRKHGADAFPWDMASDIEVPLIAEKVDAYVSILMGALRRSNIQAYPVESSDIKRAKTVSSFMKWMVRTYIPRFMTEMEANFNYFFDKGMMVSHVGWLQEDHTFLQKFDLKQIAQMSPELAQVIIGGEDDEAIIEQLQGVFPKLVIKRAERALDKLRKEGYAEFPVSRRQVDAPFVKAIPADGDIFFPPYTLDPQKAGYIFYRAFMTPQELQMKVVTDGWNKKWVDYVIENFRGSGDSEEYEYAARQSNPMSSMETSDSDFVRVVYCYQRLIDVEDGSEGIYCTVFHPQWTGEPHKPMYAKYGLVDGLEDYPFVVTRLSEQSRNLYDVQTFADLLRGAQWQVKVERDQRVDRASLATVPPLMHPPGRAPTDWGPGRKIPERRKGEISYAPIPPQDQGSERIEQTLLDHADNQIGLSEDSMLSPVKQQFYVDKALEHVRDVLKMAWKAYQAYGPEELMFRVTGVSDENVMKKGDPNEDFDLFVSFDTQNNDPETSEKKLGQLLQLAQYDKSGKFNMDNLLEVGANMVDPVLADIIVQPKEVAQEEMIRQVTDDITKLSAGIAVPARATGAEMALSILSEWAQQPDVAQKLQGDEALMGRVEEYAKAYQQQLAQMQNAEIGRIGAQPAAMGQVKTQNVNMQ